MSGHATNQALASLGAWWSDVYFRNDDHREPKIEAGDKVVLIAVPPGMVDGLPTEDQQAITQLAGKPILITGYDESGRAELEFHIGSADFRLICVSPEFIRKAV